MPDYHARTSRVYHEFDACPDGSKLPAGERLEGTGGKPLCQVCERMRGMDRSTLPEGGYVD